MAETFHSVCTLDCPDACSLTLTVEEGRITRVRGSRANPFTRGVICTKVTRYPELVHGPDRLLHPLRRTGRKGQGSFEPISWDAALDLIYERFSEIAEEYGPEAIAPLNYSGPHGLLAGASMDRRFFHRLGATRLDRPALCGGVRSEAYGATFGPVPAMRPEHVAHARLIVVWGYNLTVSHLHLMPLVNEARRAGAKLVVIDPYRVKVAEFADLHLPIRPGTDLPLAWAIAAELERTEGLDRDFIAGNVLGAEPFLERARAYPPARAAEVCGVEAEQIEQLARWYRELSPAVIAVGNGLERNQNGGNGLRAIFALPALAGKFGVRGGGILGGAAHAFPKNLAALEGVEMCPPGTRTLNIVDMGRHLTDEALEPPIKGLFVYNHNPLIVHPDQNRMRRGLAREDLFTVVAEMVMTDTAAYADVVLPNAVNFEHADLYPSYGQHFLQRAAAVIPPPGEALPNVEMFRRLAARFGFSEPAFRASDEELMDAAMMQDDPRLGGVRPSEISPEEPLSMKFDGEEAVLYKTVFPKTASGKIELESAALEKKRGHGLPAYRPLTSTFPLALISPASDKRTTSTFGGLPYSDGAWVEMHPTDAEARRLEAGMRVRVWNELGEVFLPLKVTGKLRPGVVCSHKGAWLRTSDNGQTISALTPTHHADLADGACFNDARVEVAAA
ncbi:MAG: molybdopterin-dependent oxidoreductase [SAR324 cluster bacterium]|nr:molybdopterin-dependent oxidoreductase [SAR324 cluster bacterium]